MNRILMASAIVLLSGTSFAFAAVNNASHRASNSTATTEHCPVLENQNGADETKSMCHEDRHREIDSATGSSVGHGASTGSARAKR